MILLLAFLCSWQFSLSYILMFGSLVYQARIVNDLPSHFQATCMFFGEFLCLVVFFGLHAVRRYKWNQANVAGWCLLLITQ